MAEEDQFSLCWNNFNNNLTDGFSRALSAGDFVDVTLAAEGNLLKAHKLVLSAASPYFRNILSQVPTNQPAFIFLKDVTHSTLKDLVQFMYCGEVTVKQDQLPSFISIAEALQISGLTEASHEQSIRKIIKVQLDASKKTPSPAVKREAKTAKRALTKQVVAAAPAPPTKKIKITTLSPNREDPLQVFEEAELGELPQIDIINSKTEPLSEEGDHEEEYTVQDFDDDKDVAKFEEAYLDDVDGSIGGAEYSEPDLKQEHESIEGFTKAVFGLTRRGCQKLILDGFSYTKDRQSKKTSNWKCAVFSKYRCKARAVSKLMGGMEMVKLKCAVHYHDRYVTK